MEERYLLIKERILQIESEHQIGEPYCSYFKRMALFLVDCMESYEKLPKLSLGHCTMEELKERNQKFFEDILPENYKNSYANPTFAVTALGDEFGQILSFLYTELRTLIHYLHEGATDEIVIRLELFVEIYNSFYYAYEEYGKEPKEEDIREIIYWFISDYSELEAEVRVREKVDPALDFAYRIIMESDLSDLRYLYQYGEYIGENQTETARYLDAMPEETIRLMADTYTEGYRIGFVKGNKDLSRKSVVQIVYPVGFERVVRAAIINFEKMGLKPAIMRTAHSIFHRRGVSLSGYYSSSPNKQYEYDHKEDEALFLDKKLVNRRLEEQRNAYETYREAARLHAGPAWIEVFGENPFTPETRKEALHLSEEQQKLSTFYYGKLGQIINEYIPGEERSFTIIAFPLPEIGERYPAIMDETIALNTLDYLTYENIQQNIIDALDQAVAVQITGKNGNRTDLRVSLYSLSNPDKETIFENCVADVNIPVGEVFTSPVLKGTSGTLHVSRVFLHELEYRNLEIQITDGMITDYGCSNFTEKEENRKYIRDNVLFHHETLPMGEFAIGTNTTAYSMGKKYAIESRLPILIAEKTGPHFAFGDTCYSHAEDTPVFNADGKEIVARDNEISIKRHSDQDSAYYQCHTDITIPYDELGELYGIKADGTRIPVIENGRFVLPGTEKLNEPLD